MIVDKVIGDSSELTAFCNKVRQIEQLDLVFKQCLEQNFHQQCRVANLSSGVLIISVLSPEWHHQLRYMQGDILDKLRSTKYGIGISSIKFIVQPEFLEPEIKSTIPLDPLTLSASSANYLIEAAMNVSDLKLKQALFKLSNKVSN